jgi:UDP:flavonoid glycosyltransferase YjiC (YdhE family)
MRILFTTTGGAGHFNPLVPIARAATDAGHEVAIACRASFGPTIERSGFRAFPAGYETRGRQVFELFAGVRMQPESEVDYWMHRQVFIGVYATAMVPDLLMLCRDWHPDLIVREAGEFGGCVAAEVLGIPPASVRSSAYPAKIIREHFGGALAILRDRHGLPPDPDAAMLTRYLHLACEPPGFAFPGEIPPPTTHLVRPVNDEPGEEGLPGWVADLPDRPTVYATLGTVSSGSPIGRPVFPAILAALRDEPVNLILTVGRSNDPQQFGEQPANVHIAQYIPQGMLLPYCDLAVHQGGFSTVTGVLNTGLPMVVIPMMNDQSNNAARCAALGVGAVLGPGERTPEAIRAAVREVLTDPTYRRNAERLRDEMAALPGPEHAVTLLERLAVEKQPLLTS